MQIHLTNVGHNSLMMQFLLKLIFIYVYMQRFSKKTSVQKWLFLTKFIAEEGKYAQM